MRFEQFVQVLEIARTGSLNKAAQNLFLSQPCLSQSIKSLENELGIRIFERDNTGMILTEDGHQLVSIIEPLNNQISMVPRLFKKDIAEEYLTFSVSNSYLKYALNVYIELVNKYHHEGLRSCYREVNGGEVLDDVVSQRSAIGVMFITSNTKNFMLKLFKYKEVEYHRLSDDGYWIILGPENPLFHQDMVYVTPNDIKDFPLILYEEMYKSLPYNNDFLKLFTNKSVLRVNSRASMLDLVRETVSVNVGTRSQIPYKYTDFYPNLKTIELKMDNYYQEVGWICRKNYQPNAPERFYLTRLIEITTGRRPDKLPMD